MSRITRENALIIADAIDTYVWGWKMSEDILKFRVYIINNALNDR